MIINSQVAKQQKIVDDVSAVKSRQQSDAAATQENQPTQQLNKEATTNGNPKSASKEPPRRPEPKLSVVLPANQRTLVTPTIVTTSDIGGPITPTSQLFSSLVQLNGQDAVGLFTGLPSCTPTSADSLAAANSLKGINPFFWGVSTFSNGASPAENAAAQNNTAHPSSADAEKLVRASNGSATNGDRNDEEAAKQAADRCQLTKLSFDRLQAAVFSPLQFFLSPEQLRFGLQNQHPLQVSVGESPGVQNGSLADHERATNYARMPADENQHNQQQVRQDQARFATHELPNQVVAHQQNNPPATSNPLSSSVPCSAASMFTIPVSASTNGAHCAQQSAFLSHQRATQNGSQHCCTPVCNPAEQNSHLGNNNHSKQLISPSSNMSTYQLIAAQQNQLQVARNGIINQGQLVHQQTTAPHSATNQSLLNHQPPTTTTCSMPDPSIAQARLQQTNGHAGNGASLASVCPASHELGAQQPEPPVAHHNRDQCHNQLQQHQNSLLVINGNSNNGKNCNLQQIDPKFAEFNQTRQQPIAVHYDSSGQPVGIYNPHLHQLYLTQNHQSGYNIQQQQPVSYHEVALKPTHIHHNQYIPYQHSQTNGASSTIITNAISKPQNESDLQKSGQNSQMPKESMSSSNSLSCSLSQSPNRYDPSSGNNSSARSSVNPDVDVTVAAVPIGNQDPRDSVQTNAQNTSAKKSPSRSKKQTVIHSKEPDSSNEQVVVKKKSKGGRKKKQVTHEELVARKNRSKERNRVAAKRCRQKRKQFLDELCGRIDNLNELSKRLEKENTMLKNELELWKQRHKSCDV